MDLLQNRARKRVQKVFTKPSRAKQSFKDECDVNVILKKYRQTGVLTHIRNSAARYGDFSNVTDYQSAIQQVAEAEKAFSAIPAWIREKFDNDPAAFVNFASDPKNLETMVEMGLAEKPVKTDPGASNDASKSDSSPKGAE